MRRGFKLAVRAVLLALLGLVIAYEELQWRLSALFALIGKLPVLHQLENAIRRIPRYGALFLIVTPSLVILPFKLLALYWVAGGHPILGIGAIFAAKILGTALVARIFQLTQTQLLSIRWVAWLYAKVMSWRAAAYDVWKSLPVVRWWRMRWQRIKQRPRGKWHRVWEALRVRLGAQPRKE